jgi:16S rRNA (cytidine1402-2'-O)-methyltransferase
MSFGKLYLIPSPISENIETVPKQAIDIINSLSEFIVEDEKSARHFLKKIGIKVPMNTLQLHLLNEHSKDTEIAELLVPLKEGRSVGIISDAGCPGVADPGAELVKLAHNANIEVIPLAGPSSILLALMASGLNGQNFSFAGYLPKERPERIKKLKELEHIAVTKNQTQLFIETPYRNHHMLEDILNTCSSSSMLCIACNISSADEFIKTKTIAEWKKQIPAIEKKPTVFLIGK